MKTFDVTALGEILIDFTYHSQSENGAALFEQNPGGAPANLLAAVAKLGGKAAFIGKVGDDMHGNLLKDVLEKAGIETRGMLLDTNVFTTLAFVSLAPSGERSFSFARKPGADTCLLESEVDFDLIENSHIFHIGSLSLTDEPARSATFTALEFAKKNGITVSYDPNYRAPLWKDEQTAINGMRSVLGYTDIIKISDEEITLLTDMHTPEDAAKVLLDKGVSCVIVTLGKDGAYAATQGFAARFPCPDGKVVDTTGAGDSFMGGFLYKMAQNKKRPSELTANDITEYATFANKVATICVGRRGAINAMPTLDEVNSL